MYVHIGKEYIVPSNEIIAILDLEKMLKNKSLEEILKELKLEQNIMNIAEGNHKSLLLLKKEETIRGYISNISSTTLAKRMQKEII